MRSKAVHPSSSSEFLSAAAARQIKNSAFTKAELAKVLFNQLGLNKHEAKEMTDAFFEPIIDALACGQAVKLSGFGQFQVRDKRSRPGRNPKTGTLIPITARRVVIFAASQKLKLRIAAAC